MTRADGAALLVDGTGLRVGRVAHTAKSRSAPTSSVLVATTIRSRSRAFVEGRPLGAPVSGVIGVREAHACETLMQNRSTDSDRLCAYWCRSRSSEESWTGGSAPRSVRPRCRVCARGRGDGKGVAVDEDEKVIGSGLIGDLLSEDVQLFAVKAIGTVFFPRVRRASADLLPERGRRLAASATQHERDHSDPRRRDRG